MDRKICFHWKIYDRNFTISAKYFKVLPKNQQEKGIILWTVNFKDNKINILKKRVKVNL